MGVPGGECVQVIIRLFATLRAGRFSEKTIEFGPGSTVGEVIRSIGLPKDQVTLIFVNGRHSDASTSLKDGDILSLFPPIGGG